VTPLQRFAALTDRDDAIREAVRDLEFVWGHPARDRSIAEKVGLPLAAVRARLAEMASLGLVIWTPAANEASYVAAVPMLGEIG